MKTQYRSQTQEKIVRGIRYKRFTYIDFWYTNYEGVLAEAKRLGYTHFVVLKFSGPAEVRPIDEVGAFAKQGDKLLHDHSEAFSWRLKRGRVGRWTTSVAEIRTEYLDIHGLHGIELLKKG